MAGTGAAAVIALLLKALLQQPLQHQEQLVALVAAQPWSGCRRQLTHQLSST
jgi:hypothetical protein